MQLSDLVDTVEVTRVEAQIDGLAFKSVHAAAIHGTRVRAQKLANLAGWSNNQSCSFANLVHASRHTREEMVRVLKEFTVLLEYDNGK